MTPQPRTTTPVSRPYRWWTALAVVLATGLLAGCGAADTTAASSETEPPADAATGAPAGEAFPARVVSGAPGSGEEVVVETRPTSIVSLSPTATETLWALGAEDQVVAVDDQSDYPAGVPTTKLSGYTPNVEAILAYEPDLVVSSGDGGDLVAGLKAAGVPTLLLPSATDLDEAYSQIERLGAATGHVGDAAKLVADMRRDIAAALETAESAEGLTYFHELDPTLYTVTGRTFIGEVYALFGMESIGDAAGGGDDYPQLSEEYVVEADPDLVMLADSGCCDVTPAKAAARPGWQGMRAVRNGHVLTIDEDIASRWGPRVVDFVEALAEVVGELEPAAAS